MKIQLKKITLLTLVLICSNAFIGQVGYLGKRVSLSTNANLGTLFALYNEVNLSVVLGKKIEVYGSFGTSFNSSYFSHDTRENITLNNIDASTSRSFFEGSRTTEKLAISTYGFGIRFYRKTKLAPVGHYFEIGLNHINAKVKGFDTYLQETYTYGSSIGDFIVGTKSEKVTSASMNEIIVGMHRKRVYKGGWFFAPGFKVVLYRFGDIGNDQMSKDSYASLSNNKFYFCLSFGKVLF